MTRSTPTECRYSRHLVLPQIASFISPQYLPGGSGWTKERKKSWNMGELTVLSADKVATTTTLPHPDCTKHVGADAQTESGSTPIFQRSDVSWCCWKPTLGECGSSGQQSCGGVLQVAGSHRTTDGFCSSNNDKCISDKYHPVTSSSVTSITQ
ncbi:uncharacterized protein LOC143280444 [Babylonia areolata]|uniref:uncharacterized protein LOC143280444 n=1 Tax=Babylonia areolata TaxID=304850 RepID=UPI003FD1CB8C